MKKISILLLLALFLFVGCESNKEKVTYETYKSGEKILIVIKNNFRTEKDLDIIVKFKEDNVENKVIEKKLIAVKQRDVAVGINTEDIEYDDFNIDIKYSNSRNTNVYDNMVIKSVDKEHYLDVKIKNSNDYNVKISLMNAYFLNEKFVSYDEENNINIQMNSEYESFLYHPSDADEGTEYNKNVLFINESYR